MMAKSDRKLISIFVPCFNEEGNLEELYRRVRDAIALVPEYDFEIVVSDNHSTDGSRAILRKIAAEDKSFKVIFNLRNFGPGRSGAYGFFQTSGDAVICMACDLQDPPELIPQFIAEWEQGSKVVWGRNPQSEEKRSLSFLRGLYYRIMGKATNQDKYSHISGFGLYDREVVDLLKNEGNPNPNFRYSIIEFGYEAAIIDYVKPARKAGVSSYTLWSYLDEAIRNYISSFDRPVRTMLISGAIWALAALIVCIVSLCVGIASGSIIAWGVLGVAVICLLGGIILFAIGLVGEYVNLVYSWVSKGSLVYEETRLNFDDEA